MGHAPEPGSPPTMPDPARTVDRAVGLLRGRGYTRRDALLTLYGVLLGCCYDLESVGVTEHAWINDMRADVRVRLRAYATSDTDQEA